jgi:hypothetical protein
MLENFAAKHCVERIIRERNVFAVVINVYFGIFVFVAGIFHIHADILLHFKKIFIWLSSAAEVEEAAVQLRSQLFYIKEKGSPDKIKWVEKNCRQPWLEALFSEKVCDAGFHTHAALIFCCSIPTWANLIPTITSSIISGYS